MMTEPITNEKLLKQAFELFKILHPKLAADFAAQQKYYKYGGENPTWVAFLQGYVESAKQTFANRHPEEAANLNGDGGSCKAGCYSAPEQVKCVEVKT